MATRCPARGWKGCVTISESMPVLKDGVVWRDRRNPDWTLPSIRLRDIHPTNWRWRVTPLVDLLQNRRKQPTHILAGLLDAHPIHPRRARLRNLVQTLRNQLVRQVVKQVVELLFRILPGLGCYRGSPGNWIVPLPGAASGRVARL